MDRLQIFSAAETKVLDYIWSNNTLSFGNQIVKGLELGLPQGSSLSPLLFQIEIDTLSFKLDLIQADHVLYADDLAIIMKEPDLEKILNTLKEWTSHWDM